MHPSKPGGENASIYFVGTATTILLDFHSLLFSLNSSFNGRMLSFLTGFKELICFPLTCREWEGIRLMTDVSF